MQSKFMNEAKANFKAYIEFTLQILVITKHHSFVTIAIHSIV